MLTRTQAILLAQEKAKESKEGHGYLIEQRMRTGGFTSFNPHDWVIEAILEASHNNDKVPKHR